MEQQMITLALGAAVLLGFALAFTQTMKNTARMTVIACIAAAVSGMLIYGYGYIAGGDHPLPALLRAVFSTCRLFIGDSDYGEVCGQPLFNESWMTILVWGTHLLAFYATVSAAISVIGTKFLKKLGLRFGKSGEISIIYGINADSLELAGELEQVKGNRVVLVDRNSAAEAFAASESGFVLRFDSEATEGSVKFLRSVGAVRKGVAVSVYAISKDYRENWEFARNLQESLKERAVSPERTSLTILAKEDASVLALQNHGDAYGYGFVTVFQEQSLAARLLIQKYPPCDYIAFDTDGKAAEDFHVLMVGFGRIGQENLKQLIMNGQFEGSRFRASVFAPDCEATSGFFLRQYPGILNNYDISFHPYDGRSVQLYDYLEANKDSIRYVVVNTGSAKLNGEIAEELAAALPGMGNQAPVIQCSYQEIIRKYGDSAGDKITGIYTNTVPAMHGLDTLAMLVNRQYQGAGSQGALRDWMKCDYFSRMSCRAFADFVGAYLHMMGKTEEDILSGDWLPRGALLENMSKTEHLRWCAFHYCMGFSPMSQEEYDAREKQYFFQKENQISPLIRVGKNMAGKTHACLVDWDELDVLSRRESGVSGKSVDYKQYDTDNILVIPELLREKQKS